MKKYVLLYVVSLYVLTVTAQNRLPFVKVNNLKGEVVDTHSLLRDSIPIVLTFWSTTCKPCIQELNAFTDKWSNWQEELDFKIIAVSTDDARSTSKVRTYVASNEWPFEVLLDKNQDLKRALNVNGIPHLYIFDAKGNVAYSRIGYTPGSEHHIIKVLRGL